MANPFKGPKPYEDGDQFYGREKEIQELYNLIRNESLTLLFSRSGVGKSSLIKAGMIPFLRKEPEFFPVYIHLTDAPKNLTPVANLVNFVIKKCEDELQLLNQQDYKVTMAQQANTDSLFEFIHGLKILKIEKSPEDSISEYDIKPILIFDQFEEIFTHPFENDQLDFLFQEIRCLVENEVPSYLKEAFKDLQNERILKLKNILKSKQREYRFLFAFREEYLPQFESLRRKIPSIKYTNSRFRLEPFSIETAKDIILRTADGNISSPVAAIVSKNLAAKMVGYDEDRVDPFLLSLICHVIYLDLVSTENVSEETIRPVVENAIESYLEKVYKVIHEKTKAFIEKKLITPEGTKTSIDYNEIKADAELSHEINRLINDQEYRLLSKGQFLDSEHVSILHDRLLPPLLLRRSHRVEKEQEEILEAKRLAHEKKLKKDREAQEERIAEKKRRRILVYGSIALGAIIGLIMWGIGTRNLIRFRNALVLDNAAKQRTPDDPTLALRLSEAALTRSADMEMFKTNAEQIYSDNAFYKTLLDGNKTQHTFISYAVFPDSNFILTGSLDSTSTLWDIKGRAIRSFNEPGQFGIISVSFSPDGKYIATNSLDNKVRLWKTNGSDGTKPGAVLSGKTASPINVVKFSPDNNWLLLGINDGYVQLWNLKNLEEDPVMFNDEIISASFTTGGTQILTGSKNDTVKLWAIENGRWIPIKVFIGAGQNIKVAISPADSNLIVTASADGMVRLWNTHDTLIRKFTRESIMKGQYSPKFVLSDSLKLNEFNAHKNNINTIEFSPDGTHILTGSSDRTAVLWNLKGKVVKALLGHGRRIVNVAFSKDGKQIFTGSDDNTFRLWMMRVTLKGEIIQLEDPILCAVFLDDTTLLTGSAGGEIKKWNTEGMMKLSGRFGLNNKNVTSLSFSADKKILTVSEDSIVQLRDLDGHLRNDLPGHHGQISAVAFSSDGKEILTACGDSYVRLFKQDGKLRYEFKEPGEEKVSAVAFSPDTTKILTGAIGGIARLRKKDGTLIEEFKGPEGTSVLSVAFSQDGKQVLIGSTDSARLYTIDGKLQRTFDTHQSPVKAVAFNGKDMIVTGSGDGIVRLWKTDATLLKEFKGHTGAISTVSFSVDGTKILSCSDDQTAKLWNINTTTREEMLKGDVIDRFDKEINEVLKEEKK